MTRDINRREALKAAGLGAAAAAFARFARAAATASAVPSYLQGYEQLYADQPRQAAQGWFRDARFGLFMHFGLYSLLGRHEWVMFREKIPVVEYEKLKDQFTAKKFDADFITDMALDAEMKYVTITSRHHDSFCLFGSQVSDYTSVDAPCGRDLIGELSEQCRKKGLGFFLYYSYALDWRHPYFYPREYNPIARPAYDKPEPRYKFQKDEDFQHYLDFVHAQLRELLTGYGPIAGMWFDPIMGYYARPDLFPIQETYAMVRKLQPQTLISFKQGATGDEDFAAPERSGHSLADRVERQYGAEKAAVARQAWENNKGKHNEICDTLQPRGWGYIKADDGKHKTPDQVMKMLDAAAAQQCNLLLNTGPLPDGSIHPEDIATLKEVGKRLRRA
jgi:alpha-L-fucosidase